MSQPRTAIVIGAGVAGMAAAALLAKEGIQTTVVEKLPAHGGRAGNESVDGFRFDTGPSWYLMPDAFDHFFALFGKRTAEVLDLIPLTPAYRLFPEGNAPLDVISGRTNAAALFESIEPGAGARLDEYLDSAAEVYDLALEYFLYTTFRSVRPFTRISRHYGRLARYLTEPIDSFVGRRFTDTRLRQMLTYPAVFLSSHPGRTPSIYHLMSHTDLTQGVLYPQGGFASVMDALHDLAVEQGAQFSFNTEVAAINYEGSAATGITLSDGRQLYADTIISCADLHHTETRLLPREKRTYDEAYFAPRDPGLGTVLVMLGVEGQIPELAHHNLLFSRDWDDDFAAVFDGPVPQRPLGSSRSIYVSKPSATDPGVAPAGHENLFVLVPVAAEEAVGHGDMYRDRASEQVESIADAAVEQISRWCGVEGLDRRIVVKRTLGPADFSERYHAWSGGSIGPAHTLRQSAFLRGSNRSRKLENLYYAGATTTPGVGVPMCLISAENVIKRLRGDKSPGPLPEAL
ncbi:phytoene desaturase family protein [Corynebacterium sp. P3-F1]|uniref:phytoene desaturase family protein n=1 Tax=Corynebacterium sp. P3-F1 TaxID=3059080 RepID=UPI00265D41BE|nr:phytoene desaturase family protein [Corynebacterium sp. P3-F1]WKK62091.1 phytoene desaturase family protein [Corynebacterium sp. P3-F1]